MKYINANTVHHLNISNIPSFYIYTMDENVTRCYRVKSEYTVFHFGTGTFRNDNSIVVKTINILEKTTTGNFLSIYPARRGLS